MPKRKIQQVFQEKNELKKKWENSWRNFLKKETYLTFNEKEQVAFYLALIRLLHISSYEI